MDTNTVLLIINLIISAMSPFIGSVAYFIKHISKSNCCGSTIVMRKPSISNVNTNENANEQV